MNFRQINPFMSEIVETTEGPEIAALSESEKEAQTLAARLRQSQSDERSKDYTAIAREGISLLETKATLAQEERRLKQEMMRLQRTIDMAGVFGGSVTAEQAELQSIRSQYGRVTGLLKSYKSQSRGADMKARFAAQDLRNDFPKKHGKKM